MTHQPCNCIADINSNLEEHTLDTSIALSRDLRRMTERTYSNLIRKDNRKRETRSSKPRLFAHTFCPFCGTRYEPKENLASPVDRYDEARELVVSHNKASTSFVQRNLQIGYNEAARYVERMEKDGVVSAANNCGIRTILNSAAPAEGGAA